MSKGKAKDKMSELTTDLQRVQAEFINYKRRTAEERGEIVNLVKQDVVLQLLPFLDNLERALSHLPSELNADPWVRGVQQIAKQADDALKSLGVERIQALGQPFDPHLHEAVSFEDGSGHHEIVTEELQPGYKLGDKVIRHAVVKVKKMAKVQSEVKEDK